MFHIAAAGFVDLRFLYAGYQYDKRLGLYHVRHRVYHPHLGRWLQPDPLGYIDGWNLYAYVGSSPMSFVDPWGLMGEFVWHHIVPKAVASDFADVLPENFNINDPSNGVIMRGGAHTGYSGMHRAYDAVWRDGLTLARERGERLTPNTLNALQHEILSQPRFGSWFSQARSTDIGYDGWRKLSAQGRLDRARLLFLESEGALAAAAKKKGVSVATLLASDRPVRIILKGAGKVLVVGSAIFVVSDVVAGDKSIPEAIVDELLIVVTTEEITEATREIQKEIGQRIDGGNTANFDQRMRNAGLTPGDIGGRHDRPHGERDNTCDVYGNPRKPDTGAAE